MARGDGQGRFCRLTSQNGIGDDGEGSKEIGCGGLKTGGRRSASSPGSIPFRLRRHAKKFYRPYLVLTALLSAPRLGQRERTGPARRVRDGWRTPRPNCTPRTYCGFKSAGYHDRLSWNCASGW
jgi:hypothetical protein